jgi:hypothetical protein
MKTGPFTIDRQCGIFTGSMTVSLSYTSHVSIGLKFWDNTPTGSEVGDNLFGTDRMSGGRDMGVRGSPGGIFGFWWILIGFDERNRVQVFLAPPGGSGPSYRQLFASLPLAGREASKNEKRITRDGI